MTSKAGMDYGTIASMSSFYTYKEEYLKNKSRASKRAFKESYKFLVSSLSGERKRGTLSEKEYADLMDSYEREYDETISKV
jgi:hypothetical protein